MWSGILTQGRQSKDVCLLNIEISFGPAASLVQKQKQKGKTPIQSGAN